MKYTLLKYLEDGKLYFTDVMHKMTPEERTAHIKHVLDVYTKNKNLNFYVIDEEKIPIPVELISFSLFNNHKKLFLKNIKYFDDQYGPQFYSILNEKLINRIAELLESLKSDGAVACYPAVSLPEFMERYGGMVYRMLSLSELNDFCC